MKAASEGCSLERCRSAVSNLEGLGSSLCPPVTFLVLWEAFLALKCLPSLYDVNAQQHLLYKVKGEKMKV